MNREQRMEVLEGVKNAILIEAFVACIILAGACWCLR